MSSVHILLVAGSLLFAACDSGNPASGDRDLDSEMVAALTIDGQRKLSGFELPASNDLAAIPQDPNNPLTPAKVELGKLLFHETALATSPRHESGRGTYSCATCHHAAAGFRAGRRQAIADGGIGWGVKGELRRPNPDYPEADVNVSTLLSPTVLNVAYQRVMLWDGSMGANGPNEGTDARWLTGSQAQANTLGYDGVESQSIAALKTHRLDDVGSSLVATDATYLDLWEQAFPSQPISAVNVGLAIAAYERTVLPNQAPFQKWLRGDYSAMTNKQKRGALVFVGKGQCETCHTGPALNSMAFYALGVSDMQGPQVVGSIPPSLGRGGFLNDPSEDYKFKVPQLYNLADAPFYGHGGMFGSLLEVVEYYNDAIPEVALPAGQRAPRFEPLHLTREEIDDLVEFLELSLRDPSLGRYQPKSVPSGNCIPANDPEARVSLGC